MYLAALLAAGLHSVAWFGGASGLGFGAEGGLASAEAGLGLPAGTGFSFSARSGTGIWLGLGGAIVGCAFRARRERPGGSGSSGTRTFVAAEAAVGRGGMACGFGAIGPLGAEAGPGV